MIKPAAFKLPAPTFREWDGALTSELVRVPGRFGLGQVPATRTPKAVAKSICGFCSTGCGLINHLDGDGRAVNLTPDPEYPVNLGMACPKGWEALTALDSAARGTEPLLDGKPVDWATAGETFAQRFKAILSEHGPESVAFLSTGQIMTEEMALLGAFAKFGMGVIHGDGNTRQCMATSVVAYKQSFGFDAPPFTYEDFELGDVLVFVGANPCIAHPIMWQRVLRNRNNPHLIVIDPRRTETAMAATQHLPLLPKSDLTLLYGVAHLLIRDGKIDRAFIDAHTREFDEFAKFVEPYRPARVAQETGLAREEIERLAATIAAGKAVSFWWTMGVNQSHQATRTAQAIINLALMTGNVGRPGTGANSITGQCNAMGSRLFANTTNLLGGHDFTNAAHRAKIARVLDLPVEKIPDRNSLAYDQIIEGVLEGKVKGLWIIATNPAHSWMHQDRLKEALAKLDFLVVQDMYHTSETAAAAHLFLPAAAWGEKEGTFINSERRIGVSRRVRQSPGQALADFSIFRLLAEYWGCGEMFREWTSPEAAFRLLAECSRGQPCDITGIRDYAMIQEHGGLQWPLPEQTGAADGREIAQQRRLFADGKFFTDDGRAKFVFEAKRPLPEPVNPAYPLALLSGRGSSAQWHTQTRTQQSAILRKLHPADPWLEIHPEDAAEARLHDGDWVCISSRRGECRARARITTVVSRGQVFLPMHYADINRVTHWAVDPYSRQPNYKHCAVKVEREHLSRWRAG